jgi:site-specific DNA recombinase
MSDQKLRFAPLIRVSTEAQAKRGESLNTQRKQLEAAIKSLNGDIHKWYAGPENATPDHERRILAELMNDAVQGKFEAVMVADPSRWSRDNQKSAASLTVLKEHGIRFFVGTTEYDLFDNGAELYLSMNAVMNQFHAREQAKKSIQNKVERARKGNPSCGKLPFGRRFDREHCKWEVIPECKDRVEEMAKLYLEKNVSFRELGRRFGIHFTTINRILTGRCGDTWEQRFRNKSNRIDETVTTSIPRLLSEPTIEAIRAKCRARKTWEHGSYKNRYLLSRLILDADSGSPLTGTPNGSGGRYYRSYKLKSLARKNYCVNADLIEAAVVADLFEVLSDNMALFKAVYGGDSVGEAQGKLKEQKAACEKELRALDKRLGNFGNAIGNYSDHDMSGFLETLRLRIRPIEDRRSQLQSELKFVDRQLSNLPTRTDIKTARELMRKQLEEKVEWSYFSSGHTLKNLSFEGKRQLLKLIFGGYDELGKRYGIYVTTVSDRPRKYKFTGYGRLGRVRGWVGPGDHFFTDASDVYDGNDETVETGMAEIITEEEYGSKTKYTSSSPLQPTNRTTLRALNR